MIAGPAHGSGNEELAPCRTRCCTARSVGCFVDEPCQIRGVQFDNPHIGVVAALPRDPRVDRVSARADPPVGAIGANGTAPRGLGSGAVAMDENHAAGDIVTAMKDGREVTGGVHPTEQRADPKARCEARFAQAASLRRAPASTS